MKPITGDNLTQRAIDCAMEVHRRLGQGFTKDLYENCMALELTAAGLPFRVTRTWSRRSATSLNSSLSLLRNSRTGTVFAMIPSVPHCVHTLARRRRG